jgi:hypothetical protein
MRVVMPTVVAMAMFGAGVVGRHALTGSSPARGKEQLTLVHARKLGSPRAIVQLAPIRPRVAAYPTPRPTPRPSPTVVAVATTVTSQSTSPGFSGSSSGGTSTSSTPAATGGTRNHYGVHITK